jgi:hypothetical protein
VIGGQGNGVLSFHEKRKNQRKALWRRNACGGEKKKYKTFPPTDGIRRIRFSFFWFFFFFSEKRKKRTRTPLKIRKKRTEEGCSPIRAVD